MIAAARQFGELAREYGIGSEFRIVWRDDLRDEGMLRALHCDLIVAAHPKPADLPSGWSAERLLLATGIHVLMLPAGWGGETIGEHVLIEWTRLRQARQAGNAELQFLNSESNVTLLPIDPTRH